MSSANVTISRFDALDSSSITPLIMMFHRVGPQDGHLWATFGDVLGAYSIS
jgi:hypothetical protein